MSINKGVVFASAVLALALAASAAPKSKKTDITFFVDTNVAGTQLKAGDYQVAVEGNVATFYHGGKEVAKSAVESRDAGRKITSTSLVYATEGRSLLELRLSGTSSNLVLSGSATSAGGSAAGRN
jgi:hypothetical protein